MGEAKGITHKLLVDVACRWLKAPHARGGHGCQVAVPEPRSGYTGEMPDAIGFRFTGDHKDGTVVVECKTSRADFLADRAKPHRKEGGMGNWRYFMAPEGLIRPEELPTKWGLLEVNRRGHVKVVRGVFLTRNYYECIDRMQAMLHSATDTHRELYILTRLLAKVDSPEKINEVHRECNRLRARLNAMHRLS